LRLTTHAAAFGEQIAAERVVGRLKEDLLAAIAALGHAMRKSRKRKSTLTPFFLHFFFDSISTPPWFRKLIWNRMISTRRQRNQNDLQTGSHNLES
jgi:hypothetical protein